MTTQITAFKQQRPTTNLAADVQFTLPPQKTKTGFLGVFNKRFSGPARKSFIKMALAPLCDTRSIPLGRPPKPSNDDEAVRLKSMKDSLRKWEITRNTLDRFTLIHKVNGSDPHFELHLPILDVPKFGLDYVFSLFTVVPVPQSAKDEFDDMCQGSGIQLYKPELVLANSGVAADLTSLLAPCFQGVQYKYGHQHCVMSLVFKISQEEAEHLVSEEWIAIRPVDMYPLFSAWVAAEYESRGYGKSATSISKIAGTLPVHLPEDERVDAFGIAINSNGDPLYIPAKLDNTEKYESMFNQVGSNPDGSFSLSDLDPAVATAKAKLPANIPVLVDWVNFKFSYTNSSGRIEVMPLEHVRRCTDSMAVNIINSGKVNLTMVGGWDRFCPHIGLSNNAKQFIFEEDLAALQAAGPKDIYHWMLPILRMALSTASTINSLVNRIEADFNRGAVSASLRPTGSEFTSDHSSPAWAWIQRFIGQLYPSMLNNLEPLYRQYAVSTITESLGWISLVSNYGREMATTRANAAAKNAAALNQNIDPAWTPPDAPLVTKKFGQEDSGMLPHQAKIRNLLKDSPDYAVLSVDAGGGKSMLSITDVLYEIKANRSAPYLIMCPSHLVANYVSEIVEFTDGMVNVIPITSYNIRTSGYARYTQILESAPINTILVVDYDALKFRGRTAVYGTATIEIYPVIELMRKFRPGYAMLDECHMLKNSSSARYRAVMSLIADIPKKRIASGTINPDSPSDLAGQIAIMDPTIFGSREDFNTRFGKEYTGGRVREWKDGAGEMALSMIRQNCVWAQAKRKEWACALPPRKDRFLAVDLTSAQRDVYDALFNDMVQSIRKKAETDKNAKRLLDGLSGKKATKDDEDAFGDMADTPPQADDEVDLLDEDGDIGAGLQPYLAAIEQFVSDPAGHPYAVNGFVGEDGKRYPPLSGDDLKSPKALVVAQDLKDWFASNDSKAIVFVNYTATAEAIFAAMPPELQACGFVYQASQKVEMVNRFKKDPSIKWMVGIRKSLEVGLNLQIAGLLIRLEGCWTPGEQEQGDSRIARPFFGKGGVERKVLQFDTIVANHTIDITKAARLRAKIVGLAKFENSKDERYQEIPSIPVFPMTLDYIKNQNDFGTSLAKYEESMAQLNSVILADYDEYRERIMGEGGFKFTQIQRAVTPPEAALMSRVPYAQGTELYSANDLGLVRLDNFLGTEMGAEDDNEDGDGGEDEEGIDGNDPRAEAIRAQLTMIMGLRAHTEYGEGEIVGGGAGSSSFITRVRVRLDDGSTARNLRSTNVFVVTRTETNSSDMRNRLAKAAGLSVVGEITVPGNNLKPTKVTIKMKKEEEQKRLQEEEERKKERAKSGKIGVALQLSIVNGYMRLGYDGEDPRTRKALQAAGFKIDPPYVATRIRDHKHLIAQAREWEAAGFDTSREVDNDSLSWLAHELASGGLKTNRHYTQTVQKGFQNYIRRLWKPSADKKTLHLFALVTDGGAEDPVQIRQAAKLGVDPAYGVAYLCLPFGAGFPSTREAIKEAYRRPATRWVVHSHDMSMFVGSLDGVRKVFQDLRDAGVTLNNKDELEKQAKSVRKVKPKVDKSLDLTI